VFGARPRRRAEFRIVNNLSVMTEIPYVQIDTASARVPAQAVVRGTAPASSTASFPSERMIVLRGGLNVRF